MKMKRDALAASLAISALLACAARTQAYGIAPASKPRQQQQQTEAPRRPKGPAAGPIIKLPRGAGADSEQAEQTAVEERAATEPLKWEHCAITGVSWSQRSIGIGSSARMAIATIRYFPHGSEAVEGANAEEALVNAFAKLGEEGWELAAVRESIVIREGDGQSTSTFYFKRPKRQE